MIYTHTHSRQMRPRTGRFDLISHEWVPMDSMTTLETSRGQKGITGYEAFIEEVHIRNRRKRHTVFHIPISNTPQTILESNILNMPV